MAVSDSGHEPDPYLTHRVLIDEAIDAVCRRQRLPGREREEFASEVHLHLVENDRAVLRAFEGRSSLRTYLVTVITYKYRDWRNAAWGKWRPSAEARRLGDTAVLLETLLVRDRIPFDEAEETLRSANGFTGSRQALDDIAARLPPRTGRSFVGEEALAEQASGVAADGWLDRRLSSELAGQVCAVIDRTLTSLPGEDRLILKLRFARQLTIADISRMLHIEQKPLYRRVEQLLKRLRTALETSGITADDAEQVIQRGGFDRFMFSDHTPGNSPPDVRPSDREPRVRSSREGVP